MYIVQTPIMPSTFISDVHLHIWNSIQVLNFYQIIEFKEFAVLLLSFQLPLPLEEFLYPVEQNQSLLALYLRALATQAVRQVCLR